jgi:hypothetical protein
LWDRFRAALVPVTEGLIIASGAVMARAAVTAATIVLMLQRRLDPIVLLLSGGVLGGLGLL